MLIKQYSERIPLGIGELEQELVYDFNIILEDDLIWEGCGRFNESELTLSKRMEVKLGQMLQQWLREHSDFASPRLHPPFQSVFIQDVREGVKTVN